MSCLFLKLPTTISWFNLNSKVMVKIGPSGLITCTVDGEIGGHVCGDEKLIQTDLKNEHTTIQAWAIPEKVKNTISP